jgi:hypothetical protein
MRDLISGHQHHMQAGSQLSYCIWHDGMSLNTVYKPTVK